MDRALLQATVGKARSLGARRIVVKANEGTPPPRAAPAAADRRAAKLRDDDRQQPAGSNASPPSARVLEAGRHNRPAAKWPA